MASFADIQSAWQTPAAPPPAPDGGDQPPAPPTMTVMPPKAMTTGATPTSFADVQKAWSDKSPAPASFKDDNGPTDGEIATDVAKQAGSAAIEGPIMMTVGAPGDIASASKSGGAFDKAFLGLTHKLQDWTGLGPQVGSPERAKYDSDYLGGTKAFDPVFNAVQTPTTPQILGKAGIQLPEPQTTAGRYTRMAGDFATGAAIGDAPAVLARATEGGIAPALAQTAKAAAPAAISGAGAQGATDYAQMTHNDDLVPFAQMAGAALTHGAMSGGAASASKAASLVGDSPAVAKALTVTPGFRTVGTNMQEGIAARRFADSVGDVPSFLESLKPTPAGDSSVPGFNPTTYQLTGDAGVGQLELAAKGGEDRAAQFIARTDQQKAAQAQAAQGLTTPGDPAAVAQMANQHMSDLDAAADQAHEAAHASAQQQTDAIGTGDTPDAIGGDLRSHLDAAAAASKEQYQQLYKVVNPDGTLGADTTGITQAADKIYGQMGPTAQAFLSPEEHTFASILDKYKGALLGAAPAGAGYLVKTLRSAGLHDIQDIVFDAVMHPDRARQLMKRLSPNDFRERRLDGALRASFIRQADDDPDTPPTGSPPPNQPPPTGPFSRGGRDVSQNPASDDAAKRDIRQPNVPPTRRQARILLGDGHDPEAIGKMTSQERVSATRDAVDQGVTPAARLNPDDMAKMGGALPHAVHDGRTGDGRFSQAGDILSHPDLNGRVEPTFHPDADATHQAILGHEQRLKEMAAQLTPDASVRDIAGATKKASDDVLAMVRAYHGTPHKVDRFDSSRIGSGEGNQAYGHGLYFAENEGVAKGYRDMLSSKDADFMLGNNPYKSSDLVGGARDAFDHVKDSGGDIDAAIRESRSATMKKFAAGDQDGANFWTQREQALQSMKDQGFRLGGPGNLYHVGIDREPEHFLDHDAALNEQSPHVQEALQKLGINTNRLGYGANVHQNLAEMLGAAGAAKKLSDAGLAGIRYLDQGSRGNTAPSGTRNYVVFNDRDIKITHRNGEAVPDDVRDNLLANRRSATAAQSGPATAPDANLTLRNSSTGATAQAQHVTSLWGALERFDASRDRGADPMQQAAHLAIGDRISRLAGQTPVYTVGPAEMHALARGRVKLADGYEPAGFYDPKSGHIIALDDAMKSPAEASRLMLHEGTHAALMRTIDGSASAKAIVDHLRSTALAVHLERGGNVGEHYGLTNAHEFMSETMSNPEFQRFLGSMPADDRLVRAFGLQGTGRTMWDAVVGAMRRILGLKPDEHTYLDAAMRLGDHLLTGAERHAGIRDDGSSGAGPSVRHSPPPAAVPSIGAMQANSALVSRLANLLGGH